MEATSRFSGSLAMDLAFEKQPEFSVCFDFSSDQVTHNVTTALLNYPTALTVDEGTTKVLARTSVASWLDTNGNRLEEPGEPRGPFPILARERLGEGNILLLADPSVLINGMNGFLNNSALASNMLNVVSSERVSVYFDESHRDFFDPISLTARFTGDVPTNAKVALAILAFLLTMWVATDLVNQAVAYAARQTRRAVDFLLDLVLPKSFRTRRAEKPTPLTPEEVERLSQEKHPEWNVGLVRYLIRERERHLAAGRPKSRDD
jgi:hypothetical protein